LATIRLRYSINTYRNEKGLAASPDIAQAVGLPTAEAGVSFHPVGRSVLTVGGVFFRMNGP